MEKQNIQAQKSTVEFTPMILLCYFLGSSAYTDFMQTELVLEYLCY